MKRMIFGISLILTLMAAQVALADDGINVYVNNEKLSFDVNPQIIDERTLVPMRAIFEALGAEVSWDDSSKSITAIKDDTTIKMTIGNNIVNVNANQIILDVPPQIIDGRTLVPVRTIAESFGSDVLWEGDSRSVLIDSNATYVSLKEKDTIKNILIGEWYNDEQEWSGHFGLVFSNDGSVKYEGYRFHYNGTYTILNNNEILIHFNDNYANWAGPEGTVKETLAVIDVKCTYDYNSKTLTSHFEKQYDNNEVYYTDDIYRKYNSDDVVSYEDISANINQIRDFINSGLYLEAVKECEQTAAWHMLSAADISLLDSLKTEAQNRYDEYVAGQKEISIEKAITIAKKAAYDKYEYNKDILSLNKLSDEFTYYWISLGIQYGDDYDDFDEVCTVNVRKNDGAVISILP